MKTLRYFPGLSLLLLTGILLLFFLAAGPAQMQTPNNNRFVHGTVIAVLGSAQEGKVTEVELPHASVFLVRSINPDAPVASTLSDLSGRFILKTPERGVFYPCVEAKGFVVSPRGRCSGKEFSLRDANINFGAVRVTPQTGPATASLFGTIRLSDGHLPRGFYPMLGVNAYPTVALTTRRASETVYQGFVNNFGEYAIPQVPVKREFKVRFEIEGEVLERDIDPLTGLDGGQAYELSSTFANSAPLVHALTATLNGKPIQVAAPGREVTLHAVADDPDGDKLEFR